MTRFLYIVGARPQFIKMAAVNRAAKQHSDHEQLILHTGQHYDDNMSKVFFDELEIPDPDFYLGVSGLPHGAMTGRMLEGIESVLLESRPDWVVVFGDTNSTLAGALAAVKQGIPCAHVEAGLRSYNRRMPEEINRVLADSCADLLLTPTALATKHLLQEGIPPERIRQVGDVMQDVAIYYKERAGSSESLSKFGVTSNGYVLATLHRAENTDDLAVLRPIIEGLIEVARQQPLLIPLHPRTRAVLKKAGWLAELAAHALIVDPVGYKSMVLLESNAKAIITDSGGVQKEAYFFQKPCLILRRETEWVELVEKGFHQLVNPSHEELAPLLEKACSRSYDWSEALYGSGKAGHEIIEALLHHA
jgi:UDP-GlcNAc3NAcA epimerase